MGFAMGFIAEALVSAVGEDAAAIIQARPSEYLHQNLLSTLSIGSRRAD